MTATRRHSLAIVTPGASSEPGHITFGNPVKHDGDPDPGLARFGIDQTGTIKQFLV